MGIANPFVLVPFATVKWKAIAEPKLPPEDGDVSVEII
jgi:hypothetical protein